MVVVLVYISGTLAPHARSHLVLDTSVPPSALEKLEGFSHVWVLFKFHINVESGKQRKASEGTRYAAKVCAFDSHSLF